MLITETGCEVEPDDVKSEVKLEPLVVVEAVESKSVIVYVVSEEGYAKIEDVLVVAAGAYGHQ